VQAGASVGGGVKLRQGAVTPEEGAVRRVSAKETRRVMDDVLTERERAALKLRFGLDGSSPGSLDVVGRQLGVTRVRGRSEHLPRLAVSPHSGLVTGERQVVISGTDLQGTGAPSVAIGGITATNVLADPLGQLITATTLAHAAGTVAIAVGVLAGTSVMTSPVTPADQLTYGTTTTPTSMTPRCRVKTTRATPPIARTWKRTLGCRS
jgi:hypothetical protein